MSSVEGLAALGTLARIVRYPVKSMRGEFITSAELTPVGLAGDRPYAFESEAAPPGMLRVSGHERRELLRFAARQTGLGVLVVTPAGEELAVEDPDLLAALPGFSPTRLTRSAMPQTDCRPVSLISLQTINQLGRELGTELDLRRFRANLYLDLAEPFAEDLLVGHTLQIGSTARLHILERDPRCRFITLDPDTAEPMPQLMALLHRRYQSRAGVYARVQSPGSVAMGDTLTAPAKTVP